MSAEPETRRRKRRGVKGVALALLGVAIVVSTFVFVLPRIASYGEVWETIQGLSWQWTLALVGAAAINVATFAPPWQVSLPGLRFRPALMMSQASTALSIVIPGGVAAGMAGSVAMLRGWGFSGRDIGRSVTLTSLWSQFTNLTYPVVAVFLLAAQGGQSPALVTAAFIAVAVLGVVVALLVLVLLNRGLATDLGDALARLANWARGKIRRGPVAWNGESFERFRAHSGWLLARRWHALTVASFAGSLSVFLVLFVSLRALGVSDAQVTATEAFAAWAIVRLIGTIPITPGGIGIVELGLTGFLVGFGGANAAVVAAVLVFRFWTMIPTLLLGLVAAGTWRRHQPAPRR